MLVWLDVETTGLDPHLDQILEVGVIATDEYLIEKGRRSWVVEFSGEVSEFIREMHTKSGLLALCAKSKTTFEQIEKEMHAFVHCASGGQKPILAGSSIGFDKSFLSENKYLQSFLDLLHYRVIDVSTMKELVKAWKPEIASFRPKDRKIHRALPDLEDSINELRYYRATVFR